MNRRLAIFVLIAIAAAGAALARAPAPTPQDDLVHLERLLTHKAYAVNRVEAVGDALIIVHFSSRDCRDMKVMPVSVILQESALLQQIGAPGDTRYFVYRGQHWRTSAQPPVALAHVGQQFLDIARLTPRPAMDTMLYFVVPKGCAAPLDWSAFWQSGDA